MRIVLRDGTYFVESYSSSILDIIKQRVVGPVEMAAYPTVNESTVIFDAVNTYGAIALLKTSIDILPTYRGSK